MNLIETIDAARLLLNEPLSASRSFPDNTSGFWGDSTLMTFHNLVQQECSLQIIQNYEDFFITQTTINIVAGTAQYNLPSDFVKMRRVERLTAQEPLEIVPITLNEKGRPDYWPFRSQAGMDKYYIRHSTIVFDNTPGDTVASGVMLHYIKRLSDVTASTGISEIPVEHHYTTVWGIVKYALNSQQSVNNFAIVEYDKHLQKLREFAETRQLQRPRQIKRLRGRY